MYSDDDDYQAPLSYPHIAFTASIPSDDFAFLAGKANHFSA